MGEDGMSALDRLGAIVNAVGIGDPYVCRICGATHDVEYHVCPRCGGFSVERRWD